MFEYTSPVDNGFQQFKISKLTHNSLFKYNKANIWNKFEYYFKDETIIVNEYPSLILCILMTLIYPLHVFIMLKEYKLVFIETVLNNWYSKKYGNFISNRISPDIKNPIFYELLGNSNMMEFN